MTVVEVVLFLIVLALAILLGRYYGKYGKAQRSLEDKQDIINELVKQREELREEVDTKTIEIRDCINQYEELSKVYRSLLTTQMLCHKFVVSVYSAIDEIIMKNIGNDKVTVVARKPLIGLKNQMIECHRIVFGTYTKEEIWKQVAIPVSDMSDNLKRLRDRNA